jgi:hypothetical protein
MIEKTGKPPVIFNFKSDKYSVYETPEELAEWEKLMKEEVGFSADFSNVSGTCTESGSAGTSDDCDQD